MDVLYPFFARKHSRSVKRLCGNVARIMGHPVYFKDVTLVGRPDTPVQQDIQLLGLGIQVRVRRR